MGTGFATFPLAQSTAQPNNVFYIRDPADATNEIVEVTAGGGGTASWTVTRGVGGTTPVAHATGATWVQEVSHVGLNNMDQYQGASTSTVTIASSATTNVETALAVYAPTTAEVIAGACFKFSTFGTITTVASPGIANSMTWRWGWVNSTTHGTAITNCIPGGAGNNGQTLVGSMSACPFILEAELRVISTTSAIAYINLMTQKGTGQVVAHTNAIATAVTGLTGLGPFALTWLWGNVASMSISAAAPLITRTA